MWNSPIEMLVGTITNEMDSKLDDAIVTAVQKVGIRVDKEELVRALKYDRDQYCKGYFDGYNDAMQAEEQGEEMENEDRID